jgi:16S rRNA processing protein RimM
MENNEDIAIGKIVSAVGLRGEFKIFPYSDNMERFGRGAEIVVDGAPRRVRGSRLVKGIPVVEIDGVTSREMADGLRGREVFIKSSALPDLPEGAYYIRDLVGCAVFGDGGISLGTISDVLQNRAQDVYCVTDGDGKTFLLPAVAEFVLEVDIAAKRVLTNVPDGILELKR